MNSTLLRNLYSPRSVARRLKLHVPNTPGNFFSTTHTTLQMQSEGGSLLVKFQYQPLAEQQVLKDVTNIGPKEGKSNTATAPKKRKKSEPVIKDTEVNQFITRTKKARKLKKQSQKYQQKKSGPSKLAPTVLRPSLAIAQLRAAQFCHPTTAIHKPITQQFRGYLHQTTNSLWDQTSLPPVGMTRDDVWSLHDLKRDLPINDQDLYYISSGDDSGTVDGDDTILECTVFRREQTHASDSEFDAEDILVTETRQVGNPIFGGVDYESAFSDIDDDGFLSDTSSSSTIPETPLPHNDLLERSPSPVASEEEVASEEKVASEEEKTYMAMKISELRELARTRGVKGGRTKQSVVEALINSGVEFEQQLTTRLKTASLAKPWWELILIYHPIVIEEFHRFVYNDLEIKASIPQLKQYCDAKGICFQSAEENWARHKK